jgi:SAM-dependent methyltransferase
MMTAIAPDTSAIEAKRDALIERILTDITGVWNIYALYIGDQLGLYARLADASPMTSVQLAGDLNLSERYVREWLEQQTVSGVLEVENPDDGPTERRFSLPEGHKEALTDRESLNFMAPMAQIVIGIVAPIHAVLDAFRDGGGVPYSEYPDDMRLGQAGANRNMFLYQLGTEYLPAIADVHARLQADPPARVADIGCGLGWSSIGMAKAYPNIRVDGFDLDEASVNEAKEKVEEAGLSDRVQVLLKDAGDPSLAGQYDLVTAFECVHDMSDPVSALASMRRLAGEHGTVIVMDERVGEKFTPTGNDVEQIMYGYSIFHCLPVGMADHPSVGTGTVMRPDTLRDYARAAGFADIEILPLENFFFNFYRLIR